MPLACHRRRDTWIEGRIAHPSPYTDEAIFQVGQLLRALHDATASFRPPPRAVWQPWSLRSRAPDPVISHCDNDPTTLWILAWQTRAAAWMLRHRPTLERAMLG